jgi:hypothetical protein
MTNSQSSPKEQGKDQNRLKQKKKSHTHTHTHTNVNKLHNFNGKALRLSCVKQNAQERTQTNKSQITKTQIFQQILNL